MVSEPIAIGDLMETSGVKFGTSGARGRAEDMSDAVCYAYTAAFLQHLAQQGELAPGAPVGIAKDFRPSSPRIAAACVRAVRDLGYRPVSCGDIPTPAVANYGIQEGMPTVMVTGSHIPDDRNGIKFNKATGEILKPDEEAIRRQRVLLPGSPPEFALPEPDPAAFQDYLRRYLDYFPAGCLEGMRIGLYEHSTVAREAMYAVLRGLGAQVRRLGYSARFVPVDTEAIRPEDVDLAQTWAATGDFDALVSADGDGDRPLVSDETGTWLRGDVAGILCARYLGAEVVVTPVSSNTAVDKCGWFRRVIRTRIGSPYVISAMEQAVADGAGSVVGYEANGGFLTATDISGDGRALPALPTRDALIVPLTVLLLARQQDVTVSRLVRRLPPRYTASDRIKDFPTELSRARLAALSSGDWATDRAAIEAVFAAHFGTVADLDTTDGLRITFASGEIAHLRPSGNAPELRAYNEADSSQRAAEMNRICLGILAGWRADA